MVRTGIGWMALAGVLSTPWGVGAQSLAEVEPAGAGLPLYRPAGAVAVMALATPNWIPVPTDPHDMVGAYQFLPSYATDDTQGQLFRLLMAEPGSAVADSTGRFVVVPWTVGCGCTDEGWDRADWVPPGDTVVFLLSRTRKRVDWTGPPVFDVLGWHQPYPVGDFVPYWRLGREEPTDWLTVGEFFGLLEVLPTETAFQLDPEASRRAVELWLQGSPGRAEAFPVADMLREAQKLSGG